MQKHSAVERLWFYVSRLHRGSEVILFLQKLLLHPKKLECSQDQESLLFRLRSMAFSSMLYDCRHSSQIEKIMAQPENMTALLPLETLIERRKDDFNFISSYLENIFWQALFLAHFFPQQKNIYQIYLRHETLLQALEDLLSEHWIHEQELLPLYCFRALDCVEAARDELSMDDTYRLQKVHGRSPEQMQMFFLRYTLEHLVDMLIFKGMNGFAYVLNRDLRRMATAAFQRCKTVSDPKKKPEPRASRFDSFLDMTEEERQEILDDPDFNKISYEEIQDFFNKSLLDEMGPHLVSSLLWAFLFEMDAIENIATFLFFEEEALRRMDRSKHTIGELYFFHRNFAMIAATLCRFWVAHGQAKDKVLYAKGLLGIYRLSWDLLFYHLSAHCIQAMFYAHYFDFQEQGSFYRDDLKKYLTGMLQSEGFKVYAWAEQFYGQVMLLPELCLCGQREDNAHRPSSSEDAKAASCHFTEEQIEAEFESWSACMWALNDCYDRERDLKLLFTDHERTIWKQRYTQDKQEREELRRHHVQEHAEEQAFTLLTVQMKAAFAQKMQNSITSDMFSLRDIKLLAPMMMPIKIFRELMHQVKPREAVSLKVPQRAFEIFFYGEKQWAHQQICDHLPEVYQTLSSCYGKEIQWMESVCFYEKSLFTTKSDEPCLTEEQKRDFDKKLDSLGLELMREVQEKGEGELPTMAALENIQDVNYRKDVAAMQYCDETGRYCTKDEFIRRYDFQKPASECLRPEWIDDMLSYVPKEDTLRTFDPFLFEKFVVARSKGHTVKTLKSLMLQGKKKTDHAYKLLTENLYKESKLRMSISVEQIKELQEEALSTEEEGSLQTAALDEESITRDEDNFSLTPVYTINSKPFSTMTPQEKEVFIRRRRELAPQNDCGASGSSLIELAFPIGQSYVSSFDISAFLQRISQNCRHDSYSKEDFFSNLDYLVAEYRFHKRRLVDVQFILDIIDPLLRGAIKRRPLSFVSKGITKSSFEDWFFQNWKNKGGASSDEEVKQVQASAEHHQSADTKKIKRVPDYTDTDVVVSFSFTQHPFEEDRAEAEIKETSPMETLELSGVEDALDGKEEQSSLKQTEVEPGQASTNQQKEKEKEEEVDPFAFTSKADSFDEKPLTLSDITFDVFENSSLDLETATSEEIEREIRYQMKVHAIEQEEMQRKELEAFERQLQEDIEKRRARGDFERLDKAYNKCMAKLNALKKTEEEQAALEAKKEEEASQKKSAKQEPKEKQATKHFLKQDSRKKEKSCQSSEKKAVSAQKQKALPQQQFALEHLLSPKRMHAHTVMKETYVLHRPKKEKSLTQINLEEAFECCPDLASKYKEITQELETLNQECDKVEQDPVLQSYLRLLQRYGESKYNWLYDSYFKHLADKAYEKDMQCLEGYSPKKKKASSQKKKPQELSSTESSKATPQVEDNEKTASKRETKS